MVTFVQYLNARIVLWVVLSLPACVWIYGYFQETIYYGELLHASGDLAVQLLIVTMAATPLGLMFPKATWVRWLKTRRRHLGVAAFAYSMLHAAVYIQNRPDLEFILEQATEVGMWTGWLGLLLILILAVTSNDMSVRLLKRGWKKLHRVIYIIAILVFIHWILTAFDPTSGIIHLGVLVLLEAYRVIKTWSNNRQVIRTEA